jgi:hypothetical protein
MGAARCRGSYAERQTQARERGKIARHQTPALPESNVLGANVIVARKTEPDANGVREIVYERQRTKVKRHTAADGRAQYDYDGVCLRRV